MQNRNYKVCRDNIFVGAVIATDRIFRNVDKEGNNVGKLDTCAWRHYRTMLFVPNENGLSNDLLYASPNYPIMNITDDEVCLNIKYNSKVIKDACNLAALLEYFGYNKELTYNDIMKIRKTFFSGRFAKDHCELFGWKEIMAEDLIFCDDGVEVTDSKEIAKRIKKYRENQKLGFRQFSKNPENILPREYWYVLDELGNNSLTEVLNGLKPSINSFVPYPEEGQIRKLVRF